MRQFKVCMLGAFAVGKTSLVARFSAGIFSDQYQTTVGVKIDSKDVEVGVKTIETHRQNMMRKLDIHSVAELTKYAIRRGLTSL